MTEERARRVLVANGSEYSLDRTARILAADGYEVFSAAGSTEVLAAARRHAPDVIMVDVGMGSEDAERLVPTLKVDESTCNIPILFISDTHDVAQKVRCLGEGANDYITKPFHASELLARVGVAIRLKALQDALREKNEQLAALALLDDLTGCYTRHHMEQRLMEEVTRARRYGMPLSFLMLDIDHFKQVNDTHGHPAGDAVLRRIGRILTEAVRATDVVARFGGEEFTVVAPQTSREGAVAMAERIRGQVESTPFDTGDGTVRCTVSVGVATAPNGRIPTIDVLLRRADTALYRAKDAGRNQVAIAEDLV